MVRAMPDLERPEPAAGLDPIALEVYWNRLITIMDEADLVVLRTSMSTVVAEARDFGVMLLDADGIGLAQAVLSLAHFTAMIPRTTRLMLERFPADSLVPGDVLLTNDPWIGSGHLPDVTVVTPIFHRGKRIGYIGTAAHLADVGGTLTYFGARDVFEEGLRILPCKIYKAGVPNQDVLDIIRANVRVPDLVIGDINALMASAKVAERQICEFLDDVGMDDLQAISAEVQTLSERTMAEAIARIPTGIYRYSVTIDGHGDPSVVTDQPPAPHVIEVKVSVDGGRMVVDFEGSSPETRYAAVNGSLALTAGETMTALKAALAPEIPTSEALFRPIEVLAPEGSVLNCRFPAPVKGRSITSLHCHEAVYGALAPVIPDKVQAGTGIALILVMNGQHPDGRRFNAFVIAAGGVGALSGRDGLNVASFPINTSITPTEVLENQVPIVLVRKELLPEARGDGRRKGGMGQRLVLRTSTAIPVTITMRPNNRQFPPPGLLGGGPGTLCRVTLNGQPYAPTIVTLQQGDELVCDLPGGGGFGPSGDREP